MPYESLRSLAEGQSLLRDIQLDQAMPSALRDAAKALLKSHPASEDLHHLVKARTAAMSVEQSTAIQAAREVFEVVQRNGEIGAATLPFALFTLRHYPSKTLVAAWTRGFCPIVDDCLAGDA